VPLRRSLALWIAVTVAIRAAWLARYPPVIAWDGIIYARTALRIARGLGFIDTWNNLPPYKPTAFYPVGYPALLGLGHALAGPSPWVAGALNVLAAALAVACVVALARRAFGPGREHLPAALYALSPGAVMYASTFMTETVSGALVTLTVLLAARHADGGRDRDAALTGLLLGVSGLVRPQVLALAPLVALMAAPSTAWKARARTVLIMGAMACAVVLPWTARNCAQLDGCALVSVNGGSNLWIGTDPTAEGNYRDLRFGEGCDRTRGEVSKDRCYGREARERIAAAPLDWLSLAPMKVQALLDYEAAPAVYLRFARVLSPARSEWFIKWLTAWHRVTLALALLALATVRAWPGALRLCVAAVAGTVAVHCVFFGGDRYHFVFTPLLCVVAGAVLPPKPGARP